MPYYTYTYIHDIGSASDALSYFNKYLNGLPPDEIPIKLAKIELDNTILNKIKISYFGELSDDMYDVLTGYINSYDYTTYKTMNPDQEEDITTVMIKEEDGGNTGCHFRAKSYKISTDSENQTVSLGMSFPIPISLSVLNCITKDMHEGDVINIITGKDTNVGGITANVSSGVNTMYPYFMNFYSSSCMYRGLNIRITDGTNTDDLGIILTIDEFTGAITTENNTTFDFDMSNSYILLQRYFCKDFEIGPAGHLHVPSKKIGSSYLPPGINITLEYTNNSWDTTPDKDLVFWMEYLY